MSLREGKDIDENIDEEGLFAVDSYLKKAMNHLKFAADVLSSLIWLISLNHDPSSSIPLIN